MGNSITAKRILERRKALNLTQERLASLAQTTQKNISKYETGFYTPDTHVLKRIADILKVSIDYLLGVSDIETPQKEIGVTPKESKLLELFRNLSSEKQTTLIKIAGVLLE